MPWCYYASQTAKQLGKTLARGRAIAVLPVGATEQHGPHLPLGTDSYISQKYAELALDKAGTEADFLLMPGITYGLSVEHIRYPGTVTLSPATFLAMMQDIGASLQRAGIKVLVIINCHGGNDHILQVAAREIHALGVGVYITANGQIMDELGAAPHAIHADKTETSAMMALYPQYVDAGAITGDLGDSVRRWQRIADLNAPLAETWFTDDYAVEGVIGDPGEASAEFGQTWVEGMTDGIARALRHVVSLAHGHENITRGAKEE